jgi:hypothetical protein
LCAAVVVEIVALPVVLLPGGTITLLAEAFHPARVQPGLVRGGLPVTRRRRWAALPPVRRPGARAAHPVASAALGPGALAAHCVALIGQVAGIIGIAARPILTGYGDSL